MAEPRKAPRNSSEAGVTLTIRVVPRSSRISIAQETPTQYKVRLTSPPVDGAANSQLIEFLSKKLSIAPRLIEITRGHTARTKQLTIHGVDPAAVSQLLLSK
jgi:uncharacterized protein (TIGR00251 family)